MGYTASASGDTYWVSVFPSADISYVVLTADPLASKAHGASTTPKEEYSRESPVPT
ncbi:hypothetical protein BMS3Bbin02_00040 [bacterium BMS3Bbin02]|nr:hypothetical protein BMS3Bbin02_00040 [bacterium BMS3Bbin02]